MVSSVDTFDVTPEGAIATVVTRRSVSSSVTSGSVRRRQVQSSVTANSDRKERRAWLLSWRHATPTQKDNLLAIWNTAHGGALPIDYTPPGEGSSIQVRFVGNSLDITWTGGQTYQIQVTLEEVL